LEKHPLDVLAKPHSVDTNIEKNLGPLAGLVGTWEGDQGLDVSIQSHGPEETPFRERITFEPLGPVVNGPQVLYGLRYTTTAWPRGQSDAFHEEVGYWLWDAERSQVMRCFMVPRAVTVLAVGETTADARSFEMKAEAGSGSAGILSNPFLEEAVKTVGYEVRVDLHDDGSFSYAEDTVLQIKSRGELFHHTDRNRLSKV